ncbi:hypothetical protein ABZY57_28240 [Streptomyces sp. NPDC006450]|uniref:hypothetical protein n=1 Tax=Streptomyces sp. NPDC006450 TaxID=3155458 RepID=UPI0033B9405D
MAGTPPDRRRGSCPLRYRQRQRGSAGATRRRDPFFKDFMTLADLYRYPTQHFDFHRRQLTLNGGLN